MKDLLPLSFAGENRWLWLNGVQLQMAALYGPKRTMSKNQCATQTLLRQNWKSNKKSVFNACPDQYSDLVNGRPLFPWWNRLSVVTKAVCPHVWLLNALSEVACKECALVKWTGGKKRAKTQSPLCDKQPTFGWFTFLSSLSLFDVLMKWSLNVRQVSDLHARPFLHPCTHYSTN